MINNFIDNVDNSIFDVIKLINKIKIEEMGKNYNKNKKKSKKGKKGKKGKKKINKIKSNSNSISYTKPKTKPKNNNEKEYKKGNNSNIIDSCGCGDKQPSCCLRSIKIYNQNKVPSIITSSDKIHKNLVMRNTIPQLSRLFEPIRPITNKKEESKNLYPSSYGGPPGPACNWRKCSNKGGCGTECVCHPAGWYGWRCIPKCCIGRDGYPPCKYIYGYDVMCTLPCHTWPGLCQENFWNPYHTYQGPYEYPKGQPNLKPLY